MKVKELFTDESKWTQYEMARRADGSSCYPEDKNAVCWCLLGAIRKCYGYNPSADVIVLLVNNKTSEWGMTSWNDDRKRTSIGIKALVEELDI